MTGKISLALTATEASQREIPDAISHLEIAIGEMTQSINVAIQRMGPALALRAGSAGSSSGDGIGQRLKAPLAETLHAYVDQIRQSRQELDSAVAALQL